MEGDDYEYDIADSDDERKPLEQRRRWKILAPAINNVITALGGFEGDTYVLGDECYGCLKDLKKFWRKDDTDDERTVARIFWKARVLSNDLIPILLETAGKGMVEDKCAIACADIITAMTWPIDMAAELKELDEELDKGSDYTQLLQSHLYYKSVLAQPNIIQALLGVLLPCLAKDKKERKERDVQIVNVVLHLFRNLAFIKDRPANMYSSANEAEYSYLQSKLISTYQETHVIDLFLTIASNASDPFFNQWNTLVLEVLYLLFRGVKPETLSLDQIQRSQSSLQKLLEAEDRRRLSYARTAPSRHSRFGTTITVTLNQAKLRNKEDEMEADRDRPTTQSIISHKQAALSKDSGSILDMKKRNKAKKLNKVDELGLEDNLNEDAKNALRDLARTFVETCFNAFLASLLKDIKSERPKITEKDHIRLLFVTKWFLEYFLATRAKQKENAQKDKNVSIWSFDRIAEVIERGWIIWILKRMREAVDEKPKLWTELQAGIECLTQLLLLIDNMSSSEIADPELNEASELLQQQIIYNGEVLDISVDSLRSYKEGVQSLRYLDSSIKLGYSLLRMLERWSRARGDGELYVRKKKAKRARRKGGDVIDEEEIVHDEPDSDGEHAVREIMFTFESFELKFAHEEITHTLLAYLGRYEEFDSSEQMKRVVSLLHRQAVKAKAEGLFFKVSTLNLFRTILARKDSLPKDQPYKDLVALVSYVIKKFFKAVNEDSMMIVEAFFPKNRNRWKKYSSWEPEEKEKKRGKEDKDSKLPQEVQVKKGYSWSEQLGIAIACLVENGQKELIDWVQEILSLVIRLRQRIVDETDGSSSQIQLGDMEDNDDAIKEAASKLRQPSNEAMSKFEDYLIPYVSDEQADAATKNPHLKLVFRLIKCFVLDENSDELEWYIPAAILPADLQSSSNVIKQFLETPLDLGGKKATEMLTKKARRRRRRREASDNEDEGNLLDSDDEPKKKRVKKKKEEKSYKSAQFIVDSDEEAGDDEAFWARERAQREKTEMLAAEGKIANMRSTGTKKRKKKRGAAKDYVEVDDVEAQQSQEENEDSDIESGDSNLDRTREETGSQKSKRKPSVQSRKRVRPRPAYKGGQIQGTENHDNKNSEPEINGGEAPTSGTESHAQSLRKRGRVVFSDDEDE